MEAKKVAEILPELERQNSEGANLYFGVLPRVYGGGKKQDCLPGMAVWADIDDGCLPRDAWLRAKTNGLPEPSMVINSGHGTHLYWLLKDKQDPADISKMVGDISVVLGSDPSVKDPSRIMRIPGFTNWKEPVAKASTIYIGSARYSFSDLRSAVTLPQEEIAMPASVDIVNESMESRVKRAEKYISTINGSGKGGRTNAAYRVAAILIRDFRLDDRSALELLQGWDFEVNSPPISGDKSYPAGELDRIIKHAHTFGNKQYGSKEAPVVVRQPKQQVVIKTDSKGKDITSLFDEIDAQEAGKRVTIGIRWRVLQGLSKPLRPGSVVVVAGPTKVGKSYFLTNMALDCEDADIPWKYLPLEDGWDDFAFRVLAYLAGDYDMTDVEQHCADKRRQALVKYGDKLSKIMSSVVDNPRIGTKDANGETVVPKITFDEVEQFAKTALKEARVIFIDPLSQIEATSDRRHVDEEGFIRKLLAIAKDTGGTIVLSCHTSKRSGAAQTVGLSSEDVQGSAALTRLVHTVFIMDGHEVKTSNVKNNEGVIFQQAHNRTLIIAAARNGAGTRMRLAFTQRADAPLFEEHGTLVK